MSINHNKIKVPVIKFNIGEIVSFNSNSFKQAKEFKSVWIAGDQNYVVPLMVVTEISIDSKPKFNEDTGKTKPLKNKYKCTWFSNKSLKFEEVWFFENELNSFLIENEKKSIKSSDLEDVISKGSKVIFKTNSLEIMKRKSSLDYNNHSKQRKSSALLAFSSPVFVVIGFAEVQPKEPVIDPITNTVKRIYSNKLVKVKFFNSHSDKYSEFYVPIETLSLIKNNKDKLLDTLITAKENESKCLISSENEKFLCEVKSIVYISGEYVIDLMNVFTKKEYELYLSEIKSCKILDFSINNQVPSVERDEGSMRFKIVSIQSYFEKADKESLNLLKEEDKVMSDSILFLVYKNPQEKITERYVIPLYLTLVDTGEIIVNKDGTKETKEVYYLRAYCLLRQDYRFFRIDRITSLAQINDEGIVSIGNQEFEEMIKTKSI